MIHIIKVSVPFGTEKNGTEIKKIIKVFGLVVYKSSFVSGQKAVEISQKYL